MHDARTEIAESKTSLRPPAAVSRRESLAICGISGSWSFLDDVSNGVRPATLRQIEFTARRSELVAQLIVENIVLRSARFHEVSGSCLVILLVFSDWS
jgi:hypothetical protein